MSTPLTPWGAAVVAALADGNWHPIEDVIAEAMRAVPPGVAYRRGERRRVGAYVGAPVERRKGDAVDAMESGARTIVRDVIDARVRRGTVERRGDQIRVRPHSQAQGVA